MNKVEDVMAIEQELVEYIDMIKLAREENDPELELFRMVQISNMILPPKFSLFGISLEWSQHSNKASALAVLQSRLDQLEMARQAQMNAQHTQSLTEISWGNQIRTYVLHPYRMVKDLRTNYEVSDPDSVLEGDLDDFILSFLSSSLDKDEE
ncbi:Peptide chain release factor 2 [Capsicum baccatum]|uniref:Peptide chain release factor 2 n=1 Tax=Capsicum baccatum TaxID=33114 RepID=A0A2G2XER3_CAPBA|nr:Peptide chain release factor 2 [Capsicum baccatum]